jgi:hypothetical protein
MRWLVVAAALGLAAIDCHRPEQPPVPPKPTDPTNAVLHGLHVREVADLIDGGIISDGAAAIDATGFEIDAGVPLRAQARPIGGGTGR